MRLHRVTSMPVAPVKNHHAKTGDPAQVVLPVDSQSNDPRTKVTSTNGRAPNEYDCMADGVRYFRRGTEYRDGEYSAVRAGASYRPILVTLGMLVKTIRGDGPHLEPRQSTS